MIRLLPVEPQETAPDGSLLESIAAYNRQVALVERLWQQGGALEKEAEARCPGYVACDSEIATTSPDKRAEWRAKNKERYSAERARYIAEKKALGLDDLDKLEERAREVKAARYSEVLAAPSTTPVEFLAKLDAIVTELGWRPEIEKMPEPHICEVDEREARAIVTDLDRLGGAL